MPTTVCCNTAGAGCHVAAVRSRPCAASSLGAVETCEDLASPREFGSQLSPGCLVRDWVAGRSLYPDEAVTPTGLLGAAAARSCDGVVGSAPARINVDSGPAAPPVRWRGCPVDGGIAAVAAESTGRIEGSTCSSPVPPAWVGRWSVTAD